MRSHPRRSRLISIVLGFVAITALTGIGLLISRARYLNRGIPQELPGPIAHGGVRLGVNVALDKLSDQQLETSLAEIKEVGFSAVKQPFFYSEDFDWEKSDKIVSKVIDADLVLVPLLDGDPLRDFAPPEDIHFFAQWAGSFAERYGQDLEYYIIWDEPNISEHWGDQDVNPAEYAAILSAAGAAIRAGDPDSVISAAPLAPTKETGPRNISDHIYLRSLYELGAGDSFDIIGGKPYGFDTGPDDRTVDPDSLNFSRLILLREAMEDNDDGDKAIWAGNWGWNSLPEGWQGDPSIWGQVDEETRADWTVDALERARREWPWMGYMFLENWEPGLPEDDPRWGFSITATDVVERLADVDWSSGIAYPGFYLASPEFPSQDFNGDWRFSPDFGADFGDTGDKATFRFWGTEVGLRVRRADYHGRFYVNIDGLPSEELPIDENGPALVLNSPDPAEDYLSNESVASNLSPGEHELQITAHRGNDQWALNGFTVLYRPQSQRTAPPLILLALVAGAAIVGAVWFGRFADWGSLGTSVSRYYLSLDHRLQLLLASLVAGLVALAGWFTWGQQIESVYRRLGDGGQLALTALAASTFYISPSIVVYGAALIILFVLIYLRPQWGLAIIAFSFPFYVKPKPMLDYQFSPVEIFLLVTAAAFALRWLISKIGNRDQKGDVGRQVKVIPADYAVLFFALAATVSLFFTGRLDVATNEWRVLIIEPVLLYFLLRAMRISENEMWTILDAFILGAVFMSSVGLWQYATNQNLITSEGGLMRLRSVYGSPNNVALYLGRVLPILIAYVLMGKGRRRGFYGAALLLTGSALILTFSKGALFLGLPISLLVVFIYWRLSKGGRLWPWLVGFFSVGLVVLLALLQIPQTAERLNPQGATGFLRLNLWQASLNMFRDHPLFGVGLDNFLYEYRGRYLLDSAWQEPNLNHPHNLILDLATRLGIFGLISGIWLLWAYWSAAHKLPGRAAISWRPVSVGLVAVLFNLIAHGLVDHSLFLVDLSFAFFFLLGLALWIKQDVNETVTHPANTG